MITPDHEVLVIGAGFSGIDAAIGLRRAGIDDFVILDEQDDAGGSWYTNRYPGTAVDISPGGAALRVGGSSRAVRRTRRILGPVWDHTTCAPPNAVLYVPHQEPPFRGFVRF
ncbi:NAD(P)-binding protein [Streptomyces morookaense]|uniref:NAD(P)-binding protein n=1 Tax=Streptomyces morookaense TaxID=1970 RepID=UPI003401E3C2